MAKHIDFYKKQIEIHQKAADKLSKQLLASSLLRLFVFLILCFLIYFFWGNTQVIISSIIGGIALFIFLVSRHSDLKYKSDKQKAIIKLNQTEIDVMQSRRFQDLPDGNEFEVPNHEYAQDIDLFGRGSFFQYLNRTALYEGTKKLVSILLANEIENIPQKQEAVKELSEKAKWRQEFSATASLVKTTESSTTIVNWFKEYKSFVPKFIKWLSPVFSILSIAVIVGYALGFVSEFQLILWLIVGILITGIYLKKINLLSGSVSKIQDTFHQYHQLLGMLENEAFSSAIMQDKKQAIRTESKKASQIFREFSKAIDALDQRNNMLFGIFGNGFLLWDLRQSLKLENWIAKYGLQVENWFEVIELTDAYNSLGNFSFNHPDYTFPKINSEEKGILATQLAHPLLHPEKRVANDFYIDNKEFFIVTGANMAGKSTFLRTVSLQIVMSNIGLPVCAENCEYTPIKLITSMRTSDSLNDDESYFFSELKRLKYIVNRIQHDRYFIILDEILKGTNSTDKANGSKKFVRKLVRSHSTGIIATHDLSLCEITAELPQVKNHYFDAEIINDELHFDYHFKDGICQNMNASFLLRKMEIVDE
ncbi:DNA mismatch repair protein MutS [Zunongwangia sp. SCSIO 43204]|uniref:MutS-related protein n=1 Tax=Zunongwangia sp. SCSIO 43204 TaxID=2779359 RepID=UPI001CAA221D|nr:DNA mismatch repair protein MutS [Zunongwangia sp. SCSIO 43204]UAB85666.1 DNA mismatch repair protein MutS [Zunongwangia sp. SCSIO 43204]